MQLVSARYQFGEPFNGCALTIGNFDGVHLGHQAVLRHLRAKADELQLPMAVMLFEPQPSEFFQGNQAPARLMRLRDKLYYLQQYGVDIVILQKFDRTFANFSAEDFICQQLVKQLNVKFLSVGDDFRFGAQRQGDFHLLQQAGAKYGFQVEDNHTLALGKQRISSTAIRQALADGDFIQAEKLLGRPYSIFGRVIHGNKLGRTIGFPTANIRLQRQVSPIKGVYAVKVRLESGKFFNGVANIGTRPTVNGATQLLEVHLFDFNQNIYGQWLEVEFCAKLRNEMKFSSVDELTAQIKNDVIAAKCTLG